MSSYRRIFSVSLAFLAIGLIACEDSHTIGGFLDGLAAGETVILQNNGKDDIAVSGDGAFAFSSKIADGDRYDVTVTALPENKYCTIDSKGVGIVSGEDIRDIQVSCWELWQLDGTVWLAAGQSNMEACDSFNDSDVDVEVLTYSAFKGGEYVRHEWNPIASVACFSVVGGSFAIDLAKELGESVYVVAVAEGATSISCWMESGDCFDKNVLPFTQQHIDGVLLWQGETEALQIQDAGPAGYETKLDMLIEQWREQFQDPDLPFFIVELQHYQETPESSEPSSWEIVRAAQYRIAEKVPNVFLVGSVDLTPEGCLHPTHVYQRIGSRLALMAETFLSQ